MLKYLTVSSNLKYADSLIRCANTPPNIVRVNRNVCDLYQSVYEEQKE
jgi:hypothetical protein